MIPGGNIKSGWGGYITATPYKSDNQGTASVTSGGLYQGDGYPVKIDVAEWYLKQIFYCKPIWYSGSYGATNRRVVAHDWYAKLKVFWDIGRYGIAGEGQPIRQTDSPKQDHKPAMKYFTGFKAVDPFPNTLELGLMLGAPNKLYNWNDAPWTNNQTVGNQFLQKELTPDMINREQTAAKNFAPMYLSPSAVITYADTIDSSEGDGIITQNIWLESSAHIFEITTTQELVEYSKYVANIKDRIALD